MSYYCTKPIVDDASCDVLNLILAAKMDILSAVDCDNSDVKSVMENLTKVLNEDEIKNLVSKIENFEGSLTDSAANKTEILNAIKGAKIKTVSRNNFLNLSNGFWKNR